MPRNDRAKPELKAIDYDASANICGLSAGYTGAGSKTIVPAEAVTKLHFRCPPKLAPADQLEKLRAHLEKHGFDDIEVVVHTARKNPYKSPVREAIIQATIKAADIVFGEQPVVMGVSIQGIIKIHVPHPAVLSGFGAGHLRTTCTRRRRTCRSSATSRASSLRRRSSTSSPGIRRFASDARFSQDVPRAPTLAILIGHMASHYRHMTMGIDPASPLASRTEALRSEGSS